MVRISIGMVVAMELMVGAARASSFTPLEWQQTVRDHSARRLVGQKKHMTWVRDLNRNFVDDEIEIRTKRGAKVNIIVDLNDCIPPDKIRSTFTPYGKVRYIGKLITFVMLDGVVVEDVHKISLMPEVAMVELQVPLRTTNDVATRAVQGRRGTPLYSPNTAEDLSTTLGNNVTVAVFDTGVDEAHQSLTGKFRAGFDALKFEDTNGNSIDDSCEPAPLGNGACTDADDEPGDGVTNPTDTVGHGTHVAATILGRRITGATCRSPGGTNVADCAGMAPDARLVDVKVCSTGTLNCNPTDVAEALDWLGINGRRFRVRIGNLSIADCADNDGTSAMAKQVNYLVALGYVIVVAHGDRDKCTPPLPANTRTVGSPGSASFAITVGATNDASTIDRATDTAASFHLRGPRNDFSTASPVAAALKPDLTAPGEGVVSARSGTTNGYIAMSGSSSSAALVSGAAAVILGVKPGMDPGSLKDVLLSTLDTSRNVATFPYGGSPPAPYPALWDQDFGGGMLNTFAALQVAAGGDVKFPNCVAPAAAPGTVCTLTPPLPAWNNNLDLDTVSPPRVGVANTITARVQNTGAVNAVVTVNFGVYVFSAGNNQFFHIGSQRVSLAPGINTVSQPWTPAATNHQCLQVNIEYGADTDYSNNVTQRNLSVAPSVYQVRVENPFMERARFEVVAKSSRESWKCQISDAKFELDPFECPKEITVRYHAPPGTKVNERANCDVAILAVPVAQRDAKMVVIGGVTAQTFVPKPCRNIGMVTDPRGEPIAGAKVVFEMPAREGEKGPPQRPVAVATDAEGIFIATVTPHVKQRILVEKAGVGKGLFEEVRPLCGAGQFKFVLAKERAHLAE